MKKQIIDVSRIEPVMLVVINPITSLALAVLAVFAVGLLAVYSRFPKPRSAIIPGFIGLCLGFAVLGSMMRTFFGA